MVDIYQNQVKAMGSCVDEFQEEGILIIFGEQAPEELREYCYSVSVNPIHGQIEAGQTLQIGDDTYRITAVGEEVPVTLAGLGHCTINFSGQTDVDLPGTIYVEKKSMPKVEIGTQIRIFAD